jgi:hypothetical protein
MLLTFQGFFEKGAFITNDPVAIPDGKKAILTIIDEEIKTETTIAYAGLYPAISDDILQAQYDMLGDEEW